ncbi:Vacuolar protein sorting-associated protein 11 [Orchesella cincta]|uniref:Vacuolar protein sorting-associated protein 11 homolog n=1 Tax=Orchesella cincta TaxID=48709 RepID=A0A1D2NMD7_ORCCI|nr:Vacuolar protein sorting-associated protein 11 [Orchesella cincta]
MISTLSETWLALLDASVRCGSSGRGCIYLGDSDGAVHAISRQLTAKMVAEAHIKGIVQIHQCRQSAYLLTLGEDEPAAYSLKVWDATLVEQDPMRSRLSLKSVIKLSRVKPPTCFAVHENLTLLAVGYEDGEIQLYRGELTRGRSIKPKILQREGEHGSVTGLAFKTMEKSILLFSVSKHAVTPFDVTNKDRDVNFQGDKVGGDLNCSCYAEGSSEDHFIVGRSDAVYCYTHEGRGPCYGFDGEKHLLYYFRGYLLIIALASVESYHLTIFDCANKFVAFQSTIHSSEPIKVAASEWGCLFLLTSDGSFWQLKERDLQTKMTVFYKKNHYDLAIKVAKCNNFDPEGMADIYRQYGDHLYNKGDLDGAIRQYCKTVGKLEASYVVRKYMDASRVLNLLEYLEVIHKSGIATQDMTTLLLNCLTKLKQNEKIEHYMKDPSCNFLDPETAIKVFRKGGMYKQAYQLANKHELYGCALQILIDDVRDPCKEDLYNILEKVLQTDKAEEILRKYGSSLVQLVSQVDPKSTETWRKVVALLSLSPSKRELVELFISKKEVLVPLLEDICQACQYWWNEFSDYDFESSDGPLMNLLLEAYLDQWTKNKDTDVATKEKLLALLTKAPDCPSWDWARALFACKMFGFSSGEIIAFEKLGLHNDLLAIRYAEASSNPSLWPKFFETCQKYAETKPSLWKDAFYLITTPPEGSYAAQYCPQHIVEEILERLLTQNLMEPLPIIDRLCKTRLKLGSVRQFLSKVLDRKGIEDYEEESRKLQAETTNIRQHIETLRTKPLVFQGTRCNACSQKLDFPSVHFLCQHSFHQQCFDSFAANERDCPVCWQKNRDLLEADRADKKPTKAAFDADFAVKLSNSKSNSFAVIADAFGKGIFRDEDQRPREILGPKRSIEKLRLAVAQPFDSREGTSEARLRLHEGSLSYAEKSISTSSQAPIESLLETMKKSPAVPSGFEGRRSPLTQPKAATKLPFPRVQSTSASVTSRQESPQLQKRKPPVSIIAAVQQSVKQSEPKNPFEEDGDTSNPFLEPEPEAATSKNPFEEDDYDSSLNPFAE